MTGSTAAVAPPLQGVRVLELGHFVAAPFAARLLADYGADVIKVEHPNGGDPMRRLGRGRNGHGYWWSSLARNKRFITLDLGHPEGQAVLKSLAATADVVVENFRAGQLERWGIGPDTLRADNPGLIVCRISGFGQTGPYAGRLSLASIGEAVGGLHYITGDPAQAGSAPIRASLSLGDTIAGLVAVNGILAALQGRRAGQVGQTIDTAMYEAVFGLLESTLTEYGALGLVRQPNGSSSPNFSPSNFYRSSDGKWICMAATGEQLFGRLAVLIGRSDLLDDPKFARNADRLANRVELDAIINAWMGNRTGTECEALLEQAGIPASRVFSIEDSVADPHFRARGAVVEVDDPVLGRVLHPGIFPKFEPGSTGPIVAPQQLGADNEAVYADLLGLSSDKIARLHAEGVT